MAQSNAKLRRIVLTGSVAAITATGAWYGAGLKTQQEHAERRAQVEAEPVDRLAQLNQARDSLMATKLGLEKKIAQLEHRRAAATESNTQRTDNIREH